MQLPADSTPKPCSLFLSRLPGAVSILNIKNVTCQGVSLLKQDEWTLWVLVPEKMVEKDWEGSLPWGPAQNLPSPPLFYVCDEGSEDFRSSKGSLMKKQNKTKQNKNFPSLILSSFYEIPLVSHANSSDGIFYLLPLSPLLQSGEMLSFPGCRIRFPSLSSCRSNAATNAGHWGVGWGETLGLTWGILGILF